MFRAFKRRRDRKLVGRQELTAKLSGTLPGAPHPLRILTEPSQHLHSRRNERER